MGVDLHMHIIDRKGNFLAKNLFEGERDYDWFDALQGSEAVDSFKRLPFSNGIPEELKDKIFSSEEEEKSYYGFGYITIKDFYNWFWRNRPDHNAYWTTKRQAWLYQTKKIVPSLQLYYLGGALEESGCPIEDMVFIDVIDEEDNYKKLIKIIEEDPIFSKMNDSYLVYYFDC